MPRKVCCTSVRKKGIRSADYVGNTHQMVVDYICKIISRVSVGLDQNHVVQFVIVDCDVAVNLILEGCSSLGRHIDSDNVGFSGCQICLDFLLGKVQAVFVINMNLFTAYVGRQRFQTFFITEAVISVSCSINCFAYFR